MMISELFAAYARIMLNRVLQSDPNVEAVARLADNIFLSSAMKSTTRASPLKLGISFSSSVVKMSVFI